MKAKVIAHSVQEGAPELITLQLEYPRYIHGEFMTHRCLVGDTELYFDLPNGSKGSDYRLHKMTIEDFYDKWVNGSKERKPSRYVDRDLTGVDPFTVYTAKELSTLVGFSNPSNLRTACRNGEIVVQNPLKYRHQDFQILGSDFIKWVTTPKHYRQDIGDRLRAMRIRAFDEKTGEVIHTNITDIWKVGYKPTYTLSAGSYQITGTEDHPIFTGDGWKNLGDFKAGDKIVVVSNKQPEDTLTDPTDLKKIGGKWRSVWQQKMGKKLSKEQDGLCSSCGANTLLEIHHVIPVHEDPSLCFNGDNIVCICNECHKEEHKKQGWQKGNPLTASEVTVDHVVPTGKTEAVYDLSVADENHNFVANGIVVHNCFSRNASSSRAIPATRMIKNAWKNPARPLYWGSNKAGMQAGKELTGLRLLMAKIIWSMACTFACFFSYLLHRAGLHKQHTNRITEPFQFISVIVTSTEWSNFFELRNHPDAQPEIRALAQVMLDAINSSVPTTLPRGGWHLPYITQEDVDETNNNIALLRKLSAARCARVSYLNHEGKKPTHEEDIRLFDRLVAVKPMHLSPTEHQATPSNKYNANFRFWKQHRAVLEQGE